MMISYYLNQHPNFYNYLIKNPSLLESLLLYTENMELIKMNYKEHKNNQLINKIQNMSMLIRMMRMTND